MKVQHIIQMWSLIQFQFPAVFLNGFLGHAETDIQHDIHSYKAIFGSEGSKFKFLLNIFNRI